MMMTVGTAAAETDVMSMGASSWVIVDDGVMGGLSQGHVMEGKTALVFTGTLSLENNGGFSSTRMALNQSLAGFSGIRLNLRGDGRRYQLRLRNDWRMGGVAWRAEFVAPEQWSTIELPFDRFSPTFRGRSVPQAGPVVPEKIGQIGFLLDDKTPGEFKLEVRAIEAIEK